MCAARQFAERSAAGLPSRFVGVLGCGCFQPARSSTAQRARHAAVLQIERKPSTAVLRKGEKWLQTSGALLADETTK